MRWLTAFAVPSLLLVCFAGAHGANFIDFSGQSAGSPNWSVPCSGCGGNVSVDFSTTMPGANPGWFPQLVDFTDPGFEAAYGDMAYFIGFARPGAAGEGGTTSATINFSQPLPAGSQMIALDIDAQEERLQLLTSLGVLGTPSTIETMQGATSSFADWDNGAGVQALTTTTTLNNDLEAYIWNVGGLESVDVNYSTHTGGGYVGFVVPSMPEPTSLLMLTSGAVLMLAGSRRRRAI